MAGRGWAGREERCRRGDLTCHFREGFCVLVEVSEDAEDEIRLWRLGRDMMRGGVRSLEGGG